MIKSFLVFFCLVALSYQFVCIQNISSNTSYPAYQPDFDTSVSSNYCADLITYPVSDTTATTAASRHSQSRTTYKSISAKWYTKANSNDDPTNDCLGIARMVICAHYFPRCSDTEDDFPVCSYLCDLWSNRCTSEDSLYDTLCQDHRKGDCSFASRLVPNLVLMLSCLLVPLFML